MVAPGAVTCPSCGKPTSGAARRCAHCGAIVEARAARDPEAALACPACARPTQGLACGDVELDGCLGCGGVWFDDGEVDALAGELSDQDVASEALQAARALAADAAEGRSAAYLDCPVCRQMMSRRNYQDVSGVVLQRCDGHGAWLDHAAVMRFLGLAASGAMREIDRKALAARTQQERRQLEDTRQALLAQGEAQDLTTEAQRPLDVGGILSDARTAVRLLLGLFS
jgi:Zn-finger nucleic acid-binding protein